MPRANNLGGWPCLKEPKMDKPDYDAAIVEAAEAHVEYLHSIFGVSTDMMTATNIALNAAVAAKREAVKPKLLTAEEGLRIYMERRGPSDEDMQAVLDADRASIVKVIEAIPKHFLPVAGDAAGNATLHDGYARLSDIRDALLPPRT